MGKKRKSRIPRSRGISETYIHIKDVPNGLSKEKARRYLEQHARIWAEQNFKESVIVKVRVEEGSLKVWVFVGGLTLFNFVANYGSFRSGIDHLVTDARTFSNYVIEHFGEDEGIPEAAVLRVERRLGVPGKIQRFLKSLDKFNSPDIDPNERHAKVQKLREEFIEILELLENDQDRELFMQQVPDNISHIPNVPLPEPIPGVLSLDVIRNEEDWNA
ncbi:MAG: hypothetical protein RPT95_06990 [Candidatus Sedimenticola sp. (ex Thyasira tokunagai)]